MPKLTIKEIAKMAKVSRTAVSFVLNNRKGVGEETRQKILNVIRLTNFTPNKSSRRLSFKKSFNICLIMNPKSSPFIDFFYFDITRGIVEESNHYDYNLLLNHLNHGSGQIPDSISSQDADGIICLQDTPDSILAQIKSLNIPFVLVDAQTDSDKYTTINPDSERSAYVATEYLINHGHRDIGFIGSSYLSRYYIQTTGGFKKALNNTGIKVNQKWVFVDAYDEKTAYLGMAKILKHRKIPSAVFCAGDLYAIGAIRCTQEHGYSVPRDISFIGMDDIVLSSYITPPLTTIGYNTFNMGKMAVDLLVRKINGEHVQSYIVPSENIIERASVHSFSNYSYSLQRRRIGSSSSSISEKRLTGSAK
jgi:DNA-binding LacI/PurR family transcriptional regulator